MDGYINTYTSTCTGYSVFGWIKYHMYWFNSIAETPVYFWFFVLNLCYNLSIFSYKTYQAFLACQHWQWLPTTIILDNITQKIDWLGCFMEKLSVSKFCSPCYHTWSTSYKARLIYILRKITDTINLVIHRIVTDRWFHVMICLWLPT